MVKKFHGFFALFRSPSLFLTMAPLVIMGTSRLAFALIVSFGLVWVYTITVMIARATRRFFPRMIFFNMLTLFLAAFIGSLYLLAIEFINPVLALEVALLVLLVPALCFASNIEGRTEGLTIKDALYAAAAEALAASLLLIAFSLFREPLGYGSLSLPGGIRGIIELFSLQEEAFPIQLIASAPGALFLLGYIILAFRLIKPKRTVEEEQS
jgi:Na+-transporting NADH:ubiquinone oxidoreductase subunit NqrD